MMRLVLTVRKAGLADGGEACLSSCLSGGGLASALSFPFLGCLGSGAAMRIASGRAGGDFAAGAGEGSLPLAISALVGCITRRRAPTVEPASVPARSDSNESRADAVAEDSTT